MLKRVLVVLLVLLTALGFAVSLLRAANEQRTVMEHAASSIGHNFAIPVGPRFADPDVIYPAMLAAATVSHVNVFRTAIGYDAHDRPMISHYVLLTDDTRFNDSFGLRSGAPLTAEQTRTGDRFVASTGKVGGAQTGVLSQLPGGELVYIRPLNQAFRTLPTAGSYYAECGAQASCDTFLTRLAAEIGARDQTIQVSADDFKAVDQQFAGFGDDILSILTTIAYLLIVFIAIMVLYRQVNEAKRSGLLHLHGTGTLGIWWRVTGRPVMLVLGISSGVALLAAALTPGANAVFVSMLATMLLRFFMITVIASLLACLYISRIRVAESIKNRKDTRVLFVFSMISKVAFAVLLIVTGGSLWMQYTAAAHERDQLGNWQSTTGFGVFYPTSMGNDVIEIQTGQAGPTTAEAYDLYPRLNEMGSLFVESMAFEPEALKQPMAPGQYRSMVVNPNYLLTYAVEDTQHARVTIPESETDWILLVPETYRSQSEAIANSFAQSRAGGASAEQALFGREVPAAIRDQKIRIIWTAPHQKVFSFNTLINPDSGSLINDPIIQVMTLSNSAGIDRANAITGGVNGGLKVKLIDNSTTRTLAALQSELRRLKLDDNLTHLVTLDAAALQRLHYIQQGILRIALTGVGLLIVMLILVTQSLMLLFERFARKIVARRLFGLSFIRRYREFLMIFGAVWIGKMLFAFGANSAGITPFATTTTTGAASPSTAFGIGAATLVIEFLFSAAVLGLIERRRTTDVLKGEF